MIKLIELSISNDVDGSPAHTTTNIMKITSRLFDEAAITAYEGRTYSPPGLWGKKTKIEITFIDELSEADLESVITRKVELLAHLLGLQSINVSIDGHLTMIMSDHPQTDAERSLVGKLSRDLPPFRLTS